MNKTQKILKKTFSTKYIGIIDGNMGILSRRLKLERKDKNPHLTYTLDSEGNVVRKTSYAQDLEALDPNEINRNDVHQFAGVLQTYESNPKPENYDTYIVSSYSLPKQLKTIYKPKDP